MALRLLSIQISVFEISGYSLTFNVSISLVDDVVDLLFAFEATVGHFQVHLVERFRLIEVIPVKRAYLVSVLILLCTPSCTVPFLPITTVAARTCI